MKKKATIAGQSLQPHFDTVLGKMVGQLNSARSIHDLGVDQYDLPLDQQRPFLLNKACDEKQFPVSTTTARQSCLCLKNRRRLRGYLQTAPVKGAEGIKRKILNDYGNEAEPARYVCDVVRATVVFADPYNLAVFFEMLPKHFSFVRVKNRFTNPVGTSGYRDITLNLLFEHDGQQMVVELQLALEMLLALKAYLHDFYEVLRHENLASFMATQPIFAKQLPVVRDAGEGNENNVAVDESSVETDGATPCSQLNDEDDGFVDFDDIAMWISF